MIFPRLDKEIQMLKESVDSLRNDIQQKEKTIEVEREKQKLLESEKVDLIVETYLQYKIYNCWMLTPVETAPFKSYPKSCKKKRHSWKPKKYRNETQVLRSSLYYLSNIIVTATQYQEKEKEWSEKIKRSEEVLQKEREKIRALEEDVVRIRKSHREELEKLRILIQITPSIVSVDE